jgi:ribosomal protein S18 acetylase RimI-like enzyme
MVQLTPMKPAEYDAYFEDLIQRYALENIRAGRWTEKDGAAEARKEVEKILPSGLQTANQFLFDITSGPADQRVGVVWLALEPRGGFVYDLQVFEPFRRKGYAEAAMRLLESVAQEKGAKKISLHVFGQNHGARALYAKLGFTETNVAMSKALTSDRSVDPENGTSS